MKMHTLFTVSLLLILTTNVLFCQIDTTYQAADSTSIEENVQEDQRTPEPQTITITQDTLINYDSTADLPSLTAVDIKKHSPTKAVLLSLIPGGGQIYNKKWWKVPIIYTGLAVSGHFIATNAIKTIKFRNEIFFREYGAVEYYNPEFEGYFGIANLQEDRDKTRRIMEIGIGAFAIIYALNLIDALVDAHLFYFDISDDLSMQLMPMIYNNTLQGSLTTGMTFCLKF